MDCSKFVANTIVSAGLPNLVAKGKGIGEYVNGVARIVSESREISMSQIRDGDIVTFRTTRNDHKGPDGKYDHVVIVTSTKTDENGETNSFDYVHSASKGVVTGTYTNDNKYYKFTGAYQWDTPEDESDNSTYYGGTMSEIVVTAQASNHDVQPLPMEFGKK